MHYTKNECFTGLLTLVQIVLSIVVIIIPAINICDISQCLNLKSILKSFKEIWCYILHNNIIKKCILTNVCTIIKTNL